MDQLRVQLTGQLHYGLDADIFGPVDSGGYEYGRALLPAADHGDGEFYITVLHFQPNVFLFAGHGPVCPNLYGFYFLSPIRLLSCLTFLSHISFFPFEQL